MPQTKRRRKTKHRGNAAGVIEARGRTGRKPTAAEKAGPSRGAKQQKAKVNRLDKPPTWKGSIYKSLVAAGLMMVLVFVVMHNQQPTQAFVIFPVVLVLYVPLSYYTDMWIYKRRQRQKAQQGGKAGKGAR